MTLRETTSARGCVVRLSEDQNDYVEDVTDPAALAGALVALEADRRRVAA